MVNRPDIYAAVNILSWRNKTSRERLIHSKKLKNILIKPKIKILNKKLKLNTCSNIMKMLTETATKEAKNRPLEIYSYFVKIPLNDHEKANICCILLDRSVIFSAFHAAHKVILLIKPLEDLPSYLHYNEENRNVMKFLPIFISRRLA